jgi:2-C-methyl-D-erythritol 4-phosphate cytidylyltransferase
MRVQPSSDPDIVILLGDDAPGALSDDTAESLVARLQAAPDLDAVGPLVPVVDAHKRVDVDGRVIEALERSRLAHLGRPAAVRRTALEAGRIDRIGLW